MQHTLRWLPPENRANQTQICIGDSGWQACTLRLQACKLGGAEEFIIGLRDQPDRLIHVNFGGWANNAHGIEQNGQNPIVQKPAKSKPSVGRMWKSP